MSKIVVFNGSPRKNGYTAKLLEQVVKGAKAKGTEVIEFDLNDPGIRGCIGCYYCRTHAGCAVKDYLQPMCEAIKEADAIVFGSPIYYYQITGQAKVWLDRTFPMIENDGHTITPRYPGKRVITIFAQGNSDPKVGADGIKYITNIFESYGWKLEDSIQFCGTNNPNLQKFEELSLKAFKDGENLVR
ncbi:flavodoxin family protein [Clostridium estertheticum]|uniref:flavodoxin family protein n=1 Tax=Clostridium estertheticum TaxID=238834 RepID=UPI001C0E7BBD|nr:flavodoxin family protein [Clostridium estertheticum]MBU3202354.1 flavodoxin family protein [Clostridium estertheticum]WAG66526.1 flavodoxin family protein [Clostridium estertheticum]